MQLFLNFLWSFIFFYFHLLFLALIEIIALWIAIFYTIILFRKISKPSALLLMPYFLWVSFATYLTFTVWFLNR
ncbi:MAG: tryptophan-rich sensory protein [Candidatus Levybacteria bacterium]|nr:tryptophan-rich sensory protein [Candidatus Levybacteria bacterium]